MVDQNLPASSFSVLQKRAATTLGVVFFQGIGDVPQQAIFTGRRNAEPVKICKLGQVYPACPRMYHCKKDLVAVFGFLFVLRFLVAHQSAVLAVNGPMVVSDDLVPFPYGADPHSSSEYA